MTIELTTRADVTLEAVRRVAWEGADVRIARTALARMAECKQGFLVLLDSDPAITIYGVTTGYGQMASVTLSPEERARQASRAPRAAGTSYGEAAPERLVRAMVLARLANYLEGHAAISPHVAEAVAAMLGGGPLPRVPLMGNGGAGEILAPRPPLQRSGRGRSPGAQGQPGAGQRLALRGRADRRRGAGRAQPRRSRVEGLRARRRGVQVAAGALFARARRVVG